MRYAELVQVLEPVGLPIVEPGVTTRKMPCISVEPTGMALSGGYSWVWDRCDIAIRVPLAENNAKQFYELRSYTVAVYRQLWGTQVQIDDEGPLFGSTETDPASLSFTLSVQFPSDDLCDEPPLPAPPGITLTDEFGVPIST